jgi:hypothetical protein
MSDSLLVVEAYLDQEGITHHRDNQGTVIFHLPYGRTSYDCRIRCDGLILVLTAIWNGVILADDAELAECVLVRLSNVGSGSGKTFFNPAQRALKFETSVDVSMSTLPPERVRIFRETVLDPFNIKILAMEFVLDGQLPVDVAVDIYGEWDRKPSTDRYRRSPGTRH